MRYDRDSMSHPVIPYNKEERPWGSFETLVHNEPCSVKILHVDAGKRLSLQTHAKREEFWRVISGDGLCEIQGNVRLMHPGDEARIHVGETHRLTGGAKGISVLEIAFGDFDEKDIIRLEDDFGRP